MPRHLPDPYAGSGKGFIGLALISLFFILCFIAGNTFLPITSWGGDSHVPWEPTTIQQGDR